MSLTPSSAFSASDEGHGSKLENLFYLIDDSMKKLLLTVSTFCAIFPLAAQGPVDPKQSMREGCRRMGLPPECGLVPIQPRPPSTFSPPSLKASSCGPQTYPKTSALHGEEGIVKIKIHIASDGIPTSAAVVLSSGFVLLDQATIDHVMTCKFNPAKRGDVAIPFEVNTSYEWKLNLEMPATPAQK